MTHADKCYSMQMILIPVVELLYEELALMTKSLAIN